MQSSVRDEIGDRVILRQRIVDQNKWISANLFRFGVTTGKILRVRIRVEVGLSCGGTNCVGEDHAGLGCSCEGSHRARFNSHRERLRYRLRNDSLVW